MNEQIPKIIHQIWTQGCDNIPEKYHKYTQSWKSKKDYQYICWSDTTIKELIEKYDKSLIPVYDYFTLPQQRSDFGRYLILYLYGGFYVDIDTEAGNMSLDVLLNNKVISGVGIHGIKQSFIGSVPFHPAFKDLIDHIRKSYERRWYEIIDVIYVNRTSGGEAYKSIIDNYNDVYKIKDKKQTPQCNFFEEDCSNEKYKEAFCIQHTEETWNVFLICQNFIKFYRYIMISTIIFLIYISFSNCSGYGMKTLCSFRTVIILLSLLTMLYSMCFFLLNAKFCRTSLLYFVLLMVSYFSLSKKCNICNIKV